MKWLLIGDVHGNLPALEILLKKEKGNFDFIICHGDVVNYGPWSNECVQLLDSIDNAVCLKGNHETYFIEGCYPGTHPVAKAYFAQCFPKFSESNRIKGYKEFFPLGSFQVQHTILNQYIFADTPIDEITVQKNYIIGHSHQQFERIIGEHLLINTGSLGQNRKYINIADYLLFDDVKQKISLRNFIYDIDVVIKEMEKRDYSTVCLNYYKNKDRA